MKFCSGFRFQLSTTSKQSLTADTQLARILDQNLDFTLKAVTSKIDKTTSFPSPAASHPVLERCLSEKHIWRDHSSPTLTVTLLQCWKVKDSFVPVLQWCWSGSKIRVYEGTCTFRHLHRAQEPTAQGNSYWVNHNSGLRPASGAQISCSNLALNSLCQVWGFESLACKVLLSLCWVLLWFLNPTLLCSSKWSHVGETLAQIQKSTASP